MPDPVMTPREYYQAVLEMLEYEGRIDPTDKTAAMREYDAEDPTRLDQMFGLAGTGDVRHAHEGYENYREAAGQPIPPLPKRAISTEPAEAYYMSRTGVWEDTDQLNRQLVEALKAQQEMLESEDKSYSQTLPPDREGIVPPPDKPGYARPRVDVSIGPAEDVREQAPVSVGRAEMIDPREMLLRLKAAEEARGGQEQAHKFMLGRPKYG